ncbi:Protein of unknown function [Arenibacter nanhaiticus]|uniref:DUF2851 domain-containing protein n=1 Tax=Arenibacter nanhaiticus TaxID=558155 RepID=A0A1M6HUZ3_9FLAO|nr:DUF2851 family protein [Arenibacter nanhaiticus]SHJ26036.1 Protein of unknown function [Arenibacter nanhaiticus]
MREDLLHFIWKYKKLPLEELYTSKNEEVSIVDVGLHNMLSGPDFFNAKIEIGGQLWAGTVEIHVKSSDWYAHHHEVDDNYNNVILHVVWEDDIAVFSNNNTEIPTLVLKDYISPSILAAYQKLFHNKGNGFINCEKAIAQIETFVFDHWIERLYFERLEQKSLQVMGLLEQSKNDWEAIFFALLAKSFGLKINGDIFFRIGKELDFSIIRKIQNNPLQLEALLLGKAGLLSEEIQGDEYLELLKKEYHYIGLKFNILEEPFQKAEFFKLRPHNFPTIRLSQLTAVYGKHQNLFRKIINASHIEEFYTIFNVSANAYWENHYTFGKLSKKSPKRLTKRFIDLLVINTILPLKLSYAKYLGQEENDQILRIITGIKAESNHIISKFHGLQITVPSAKESQGILELYNNYCTKNKCLQCAVGNQLMNRKP